MADAENRLKIRLVTPDRILVDGEADAVELPSRSGCLEVLYGHAPLLAELGVGWVKLHGLSGGARESQESQEYLVAWGFVEVLPDRVTILTPTVDKPGQTDRAEAERRLESGRKLWNEAGEDPAKYEEANAVIHEAEVKLEAAKGGA